MTRYDAVTTGDDATSGPETNRHETGTGGSTPAVVREQRDGTELLVLSGDLDLDVVGEITPVLDSALKTQPAGLVIDLSEVSFADSSALNMLLRTHAQTSLHLAGPLNAAVRRLFEITGIETVLNLHEDREAALSAARAKG